MNQSQSIRPPQVEKTLTLSSLPKVPLPQPVPNIYSFTPQNVPKMNCHYHTQEYINFFCRNSQLPLCKQCVPIHQKDMQNRGQTTNIIPLDVALTEVNAGLAQQANDLTRMYYRLQELQSLIASQNVYDKGSLLTNPVQLVESARQQVHSIVDNYFNTLITFLRARVPESMGRQPDINRLPELKQRWEDNLRLLESLKTNQCLENIIHYFQGSLTEDNDHLLQISEQELRDLEILLRGLPRGIDIPQLHVDPLFLQSFLWALERYAYFYPPQMDIIDDHPLPMFPEPRVVEVHHHHQEPDKKVSRSQKLSELRKLIEFQQQQLNQPINPIINTSIPQYTQVHTQTYPVSFNPIHTYGSPIQLHQYTPSYQGFIPQPQINLGQQSPQILDSIYPSKIK